MFFSSSVSLDLCAHVTLHQQTPPVSGIAQQTGKGKESNLLDGDTLAFWPLKDEIDWDDEMKNRSSLKVFGLL